MKAFRPFLVFRLFLRTSRVQKKRAILTIAAIAWGSLSLLLLLAFGEGMKRQLSIAQNGMGQSIAVIWGGETTLPWQGMPAGRRIWFSYDDIDLIRERVPDLEAVSGEVRNWRTATSFTYGRRTVNSPVKGASLTYGALRNHIARPGGRWLNPLDDRLRRRVIFLGWELAEDIFRSVDVVGKTLLVNNVPYTVVGVMKEKMQMGSYGGPDEGTAVIPLSTFKAHFGGDWIENLVVKPNRPERMEAVLTKVREVMGAKYGFDPKDERAIGVWDTVRTGAIFDNMMIGIQMFLGIIGALTLFVGGIGVANIMYAVVKERTREIGVKMAMGARASWITGPLILEGFLYTLLGGVLGFVMATILVILMELAPTGGNEAIEFLGKPTLSVPIAVANAAFLGLIGLLAAYFPARRAAAVDPVETLRYE
jgi:putative ABC transport system permease protein